MPTLHQTIKKARQQRGLSLSGAAELLGMSKTSLHRMETGGSVSMEKLVAIASGYGISPGSLLDGSIQVPISEMDLELVAEVVRLVLVTSHDMKPQPEPNRLAATVVEVIKLTQQDRARADGSSTDPARYAGVIRASLGH